MRSLWLNRAMCSIIKAPRFRLRFQELQRDKKQVLIHEWESSPTLQWSFKTWDVESPQEPPAVTLDDGSRPRSLLNACVSDDFRGSSFHRGIFCFGSSILYNPSSRQTKLLPALLTSSHKKVAGRTCFLAFDSISGDYQVLSLTVYETPFSFAAVGNQEYQYHLFVRGGTWRQLHCPLPFHSHSGDYYNSLSTDSSIYYLGDSPARITQLIHFHIASSTFAAIELPQELRGFLWSSSTVLFEYRGRPTIALRRVDNHLATLWSLVDPATSSWSQTLVATHRFQQGLTGDPLSIYLEGSTPSEKLIFTMEKTFHFFAMEQRHSFVVYLDQQTGNLRRFRIPFIHSRPSLRVRFFWNNRPSIIVL